MRRGRKRRDERGAAAVEAALIMPILFLLVFGIIEMGFLMRDNVAVTSAVRVGARIASAAPGAGEATCDAGTTCAPKTTPKFAQMAADAIQVNGSAMPMDQIDVIWIYRANANGYTGASTSWIGATCASNCVEFKWVPTRNAFRYVRGQWNEATVVSCPTTAQRLGVRMVTRHPFVTGMWKPITVEDHAVMTFEPETLDKCKNTEPVTP